MTTQASAYKWSSIDRVANTVITFGGNIALARLLSPDDFGLLAMVAIFSAIAFNLTSCGMSDGLIKKAEPTAEDYSTVFTFNTMAGIVFCLLFIGCSHLIADFFNQPALVHIMWAIGICLVFQTMCFVQETKMRKFLEIKKLAIVRLCATATAVGLGIVLAAIGCGYWGLVSARIFLSFFQWVYFMIASRWLPRFGLYKESLKEMLGFGVFLMLAYVLGQVGRNINTFVLGRYSPSESGLFSQGQKMEEVPFGTLEVIINSPFYPLISNEHNSTRRREMILNTLSWAVTLGVTCAMVIVLVSKPAFLVLFGEKWVDAVPVFRILVCFGVISLFKYNLQAVLKVYGMSKRIFVLTLLEVVTQLALLAIVFHNGMLWIAWSQVWAAMLLIGVYVAVFCRATSISLVHLSRSCVSQLGVPVTTAAITLAVALHAQPSMVPIASLAITLATFVAVALILWHFFPSTFYVRIKQLITNRL